MNTYSPREPLLPSIGPEQPHSDSADEIRSGTEDLSSIAMVCDGILASLNALPDCPDATKMTVGARIGMILSMFSESELQARKDRMRITALKCDLRRTKEQLAVLRQEHFGQSSEKDRDGEPDIPDDGEDEEEEESQALVRKGKRTRRVPADIPIREVHHYPDGMNCCSCDCEMKTIAFDGRLEIDNNPVERCIRGIALTKKNSLFAGNHETAKVWAIYYTLIESARLNSIDPRRYLSWVIGEIERTHGDIDYGALMPWHCPVGRLAG